MKSTGKNMDVHVGNVIVSYNDQGQQDKPIIIFIHGFPLDKSMWSRQEEALKNDYRVISYDVRGHGKTSAGTEDFSMELFCDDLIHFMDILEIDKAVICGLSMGGYVALRAIEKYPEYFNALVLCDTQCIADTPEGKEKRMKTIESIRQNGKSAFAEQNVKNLLLPETLTTRPAEAKAVLNMTLQMKDEDICSTLLALANRDETCSRLDEIKVPVLIMVGEEDKLTPPERSQFMNSKIKNSTLHIIDKAAHISNMENAEAFNRYLREFLKNG